MQPGDLVVITLREPRDQVWGLLIRLDAAGVVIRGMDVRNIDDWARQFRMNRPPELGPATVYYPSHRIESVTRDQQIGTVPSIESRVRDITEAEDVSELLGE